MRSALPAPARPKAPGPGSGTRNAGQGHVVDRGYDWVRCREVMGLVGAWGCGGPGVVRGPGGGGGGCVVPAREPLRPACVRARPALWGPGGSRDGALVGMRIMGGEAWSPPGSRPHRLGRGCGRLAGCISASDPHRPGQGNATPRQSTNGTSCDSPSSRLTSVCGAQCRAAAVPRFIHIAHVCRGSGFHEVCVCARACVIRCAVPRTETGKSSHGHILLCARFDRRMRP